MITKVMTVNMERQGLLLNTTSEIDLEKLAGRKRAGELEQVNSTKRNLCETQ